MTPMARKLFVGISLCTALAIYVVTRPIPERPRPTLTAEQLAQLQPARADPPPPPSPRAAQPPPAPEDEPEDPGLAPEIFEDGEGS